MMVDDGRPRYSRRLGARAPVDGAQLSWRPIVARKRFARKQFPENACLVDLSLTGARIRAQVDPRIRIDTQIVVAAGGGSGVVRVRRIERGEYPDEAIYAVEFVQKNDVLTELINDTLGARRPQDLVWLWNRTTRDRSVPGAEDAPRVCRGVGCLRLAIAGVG